MPHPTRTADGRADSERGRAAPRARRTDARLARKCALRALAYLSAIGLAGFVSVQAYRGALAVSSIVEERSQRRQLILAIERTLSSLKDAELGQGGYLLTRDPTERGFVSGAEFELHRYLAELNRLVDGNPAGIHRARQLTSLLQTKLLEIQRTLDFAERSDEGAARVALIRDRQSRRDEQLRFLADHWLDEERAKLDANTRAVAEKLQANARFSFWGGLFSFLLVLGITFTLRRQDRRRRSAERELAEFGKERLMQLMEAMPQIVWTTDSRGGLNFCNRRWVEYTGMPLEEALGQGWQSALHPEDRAVCEGKWKLSVTKA